MVEYITPHMSLENRLDNSWLDDASVEIDELEIPSYDIVSSPNDWNFTTIVNFIESGAMKIPSFQRNYVWDRKRASKLIESLLIGLPVPQVFLYEEGRNSFIVIDGQQRLLTLYFFAKGRFPKPSIRGRLRPSFGQGALSDELLADNELFEPFKLSLSKSASGHMNRFHGLTYETLEEEKINLDLRTIRNVVVKQTTPAGDSAVFEIFSRLNTGGVNLSPQEIRASLYHSELFNEVLEINQQDYWRRLLGMPNPDPRMRDIEFLLRGLALARGVDHFSGSMASFINTFCHQAQSFSETQAQEAATDIVTFLRLFDNAPSDVFMRGPKFSGVLFESFFAGWIRAGRPALGADSISAAVEGVKTSSAFADTLQEGSTKPSNIKPRIALAQAAVAELGE